jgi:hypothetical protein
MLPGHSIKLGRQMPNEDRSDAYLDERYRSMELRIPQEKTLAHRFVKLLLTVCQSTNITFSHGYAYRIQMLH